jgi:hypothetical protein
LRWSIERVEALRDPSAVAERGFRPIDAAKRGADQRAKPRSRRTSESRTAAVKSGAVQPAPPRSARSSGRARGRASSADDAPVNAFDESRAPLDTSADFEPSQRAPIALHSRAEAPDLAMEKRLAGIDWSRARSELAEHGSFTIERLLEPRRCAALRAWFELADLFQRSVDMAPRGYGVGTYRYFKEPLPEPAFTLRERLYAELLPLAREEISTSREHSARGRRSTHSRSEWPDSLSEYFERCRAAGQRRGSSILLAYSRGGVNHPHRDIYGKLSFPYQAVLVLSARGKDFEGGDFLLSTRESDGASGEIERQRTLPLDCGDLCIFASRGYHAGANDTTDPRGGSIEAAGDRATLERRSLRHASERSRWIEQKHGLTTVTNGERFALGLVLHLAQ